MRYKDVIAAWNANNESSRLWGEITDRERIEFALSRSGKVEKQEPVACSHCDGTGDVHSFDGEWRGECDCGAAQYNQIDRFLRDSLGDEDYAEYSAALDKVASRQPCQEFDGWKQTLHQVLTDTAKELGCQADNEEILATIDKLKALSVTNILIDVVPGDGNGLEIYAKSVSDVEALLSRLGEKAEDYDLLKPEYEKLKAGLPIRDQFFCADCQDTGWLQNRVEGEYPCTCMTEAEPYQLLEAERDELTRQVAHWKANHASVVEQARILKERPDMPIERVKAYENWVAMAAQVEKMRMALGKCSYDSLNMSLETWREIREAAALPDLSTGILNRVRAEALQKTADLVHEQAVNAVADAIGGNAYDCVRVWSAWSYGTMAPDDFVPIIDQPERLSEISEAVLGTLRALAADMEAGK